MIFCDENGNEVRSHNEAMVFIFLDKDNITINIPGVQNISGRIVSRQKEDDRVKLVIEHKYNNHTTYSYAAADKLGFHVTVHECLYFLFYRIDNPVNPIIKSTLQ